MVKKQLLSFAACVAFVAAGVVSAAEVNVYSARSEELIKPALDRFSEETGIEVNLITESADALIRRIELEGANSPADVLLTVDAGRLFRAKEAGILAPLESDILTQRIPAAYRDPDNQWFGLSLRSRSLCLINRAFQPPKFLATKISPILSGKVRYAFGPRAISTISLYLPRS